jgi:hypothetical protein
MPEYEVLLREVVEYSLSVKAEDEAEAIEVAWDILDSGDNREEYYRSEYEGECEAIELGEY